MEDLYDILGISRQATEAEIKAAYRRLAKRYHPDVNPSPRAAEDFDRITRAYRILGNAHLRALYDQGRLEDYEQQARRSEYVAAVEREIEEIIEELLRQDREEVALRKSVVLLLVALLFSSFLMAFLRPPFFEEGSFPVRVGLLLLFGSGIRELMRTGRLCLEHYTREEDVTLSLLGGERSEEKKLTRRQGLWLVGGGYVAALCLGSLLRWLVASGSPDVLGENLVSVIIIPPVAVYAVLKLRALGEALERIMP